MTEDHSDHLSNDASLPEIWTSLKERLEPTVSRSRYLVSEDSNQSAETIENLFDAHDIALNRPVSLKQCNPENTDPSEVESFISEARLTGRLQHPNIIPVHDLLPAEDGSLYFTLRYVDGEKLNTTLTETDRLLTLNEGLNIVVKVCDAIAYAHSNGVYHANLSTQSIMIGKYGEVYVLNWGHAVNDVSEPSEYIYRDVNALGKMLRDVVEKTIGNDGKIPLSLQAVLNRISRPKRSAYASVDELREDITRFQAGRPTMAEEASPLRQLVLLAGRHKLESAALFTAVIIAAIMTLWFIQGIQYERDRAVEAAVRAETNKLRARKHAEKEQQHLKKLKALVPIMKGQITIDLANGRPEDAMKLAEAALELTRDAPDQELLETTGDILQLLYRFEDSLQSYESIPLTRENSARIQKKMAVSARYKGRVNPEDPGDNVLMGLCLEFEAANRVDEANYMLSQFRERQYRALKRLGAQSISGSGDRYAINISSGGRVEAQARSGELDLNWHLLDKSTSNFTALGELPFSSLTCLPSHQISGLDGLQRKPLTTLVLGETRVSELSPLSELPLRRLEIKSSKVTSLEPLRSVPLNILILRDSPFSDLRPLSGLALKTLDVTGSSVSDLSPVSSKCLEILSVAETSVNTLDGVDSSCLKRLNISYSKVASLDALKGAKLVALRAAGTSVSDLSPLMGQPLEQVAVDKTKVTTLDPLKGCPLTSLSAADTAITSLNAIADTGSLTHLNVAGLHITDLPANRWHRLKTLDASGSTLTSLDALTKCPLRSVNLAGTRVTDLTAVVSPLLYELNVKDTGVTDLTPLAGSTVKHLNLSGTPVQNLSGLATVSLSALDVSNTSVTDLNGLESMPLILLDIRGTNVVDLSLLKGMPLQVLKLDRQQLDNNRDTVKAMPFLKHIFVEKKHVDPQTLPAVDRL